jgi:hypothetical protein
MYSGEMLFDMHQRIKHMYVCMWVVLSWHSYGDKIVPAHGHG